MKEADVCLKIKEYCVKIKQEGLTVPSALSEGEDVEQFFQGKLWYLCEYRLVRLSTEVSQSILKSQH